MEKTVIQPPRPGDWVWRVDWEGIVGEHGTPLYIYDLNTVKERARRVLLEFTYRPRRVLYSLKANPHPQVLGELLVMGLGAETVSLGEVKRALEVGFPPERISYTACCVSGEELLEVARLGVSINADSVGQARLLHGAGVETLGLRINPGVGSGHHRYTVTGGPGSKFGLLPQEALRLARDLGGGFASRVRRLHFHVGSGVWDPGVYLEALRKILPLLDVYVEVEEIDVGGGMAYDYLAGLREFDYSGLALGIGGVLEEAGLGGLRVTIEPGRYIVAPAGVLLARVTEVKRREDSLIVGVDTGMNHLIRPVLYGAMHRVVFPLHRGRLEWEERGLLVGNVCESGDILAHGVPLPPNLGVGDIVLILDTGAYGASMASSYNIRPPPREVVIRA